MPPGIIVATIGITDNGTVTAEDFDFAEQLITVNATLNPLNIDHEGANSNDGLIHRRASQSATILASIQSSDTGFGVGAGFFSLTISNFGEGASLAYKRASVQFRVGAFATVASRLATIYIPPSSKVGTITAQMIVNDSYNTGPATFPLSIYRIPDVYSLSVLQQWPAALPPNGTKGFNHRVAVMQVLGGTGSGFARYRGRVLVFLQTPYGIDGKLTVSIGVRPSEPATFPLSITIFDNNTNQQAAITLQITTITNPTISAPALALITINAAPRVLITAHAAGRGLPSIIAVSPLTTGDESNPPPDYLTTGINPPATLTINHGQSFGITSAHAYIGQSNIATSAITATYAIEAADDASQMASATVIIAAVNALEVFADNNNATVVNVGGVLVPQTRGGYGDSVISVFHGGGIDYASGTITFQSNGIISLTLIAHNTGAGILGKRATMAYTLLANSDLFIHAPPRHKRHPTPRTKPNTA